MRFQFSYIIIPLFCVTSIASAQTNPFSPVTGADSTYARARQLVVSGNGAAGRVLVDSMIAVTSPETPAFGDALYWRAALASSSVDAERDYRQVIVDYPLAPRAGDALLQLAQLENARGDRGQAVTHLQRFLIENPKNPEWSRAGLLFVKLSFDQGKAQVGCTFLGRMLREIPESSVELRNQLTYYSPRCQGVDTTKFNEPVHNQQASKDTSTPATGENAQPKQVAKSSSKRAPEPAATGKKSGGGYTLQVAAYDTRAEAEASMKRFTARGYDARVTGTTKPFRVRIGHYATRAAAAAALSDLKAKKINAFVADDDK